tara:strand:- start:660 stop:1145 length:486 start_codon:yes stop_codon:yes gene_type:complete
MEYKYTITGLAIAILSAVLFMVFRPEFSMISGGNIDNTRIIGIGTKGDIYLSDNTVKSMNTLIDEMKKSVNNLRTELNNKINTTRDGLIKNQIEAAKSGAIAEAQKRIDKGDFIRNNSSIRIKSSKDRCLFNAGDDDDTRSKFGTQQCYHSSEGVLRINRT